MIIDSTLSVVEDKMGKFRRLDQIVAARRVKKELQETEIRSFLIKEGKDPERWRDTIVFRENNVITEVQLLDIDRRWVEAKFEKQINALITKFVTFMSLGLRSRKNREPLV